MMTLPMSCFKALSREQLGWIRTDGCSVDTVCDQVESARRVVRVAQVATRKLRRHGLLAQLSLIISTSFYFVSSTLVSSCHQCILLSLVRGCRGITDSALSRLALCGTGGKSQKNASRNLHKLIIREGRSLPIDVTFVPTPCRSMKGKPKIEENQLSSFATLNLATVPAYILPGSNFGWP